MKKYLPDIGYTVLFGILSIILGAARFPVPGTAEVFSDLREIPLLLAIFHIRRPVFIVGLCLITTASIFFYDSGYFSSTLLMHLVGLLCTWFYYYRFVKKAHGEKTILYWVAWTFVYYFVLVVPVMLIADILFKNDNSPFFEVYPTVFKSLYFEYLSAMMITTSYLLQLQTKKELKKINLTLEDRISERTNVLNQLNEELRFSHEEIMKLNTNLEKEVGERTASLRIQLEKLNAYAFSNSHEVRAPLARMLGLMHLIKLERSASNIEALLTKLEIESKELDQIIRRMNRILEAEDLIDVK